MKTQTGKLTSNDWKTRTAVALLFSVSLSVSGCSTLEKVADSQHPPVEKLILNELSNEERSELRRSVVLVDYTSTQPSIRGVPAEGKVSAAFTGSLAGGFQGFVESAEFPPAAIVFVPIGIVVGGIAGAAGVPTKDTAQEQITAASSLIVRTDAHNQLIKNLNRVPVLTAENEFSVFALRPGAGGANDARLTEILSQTDSYLELQILQIGTQTARYNPSLIAYDVVDVLVRLRARLIRTGNEEILYEGIYSIRNKASESRPLEEWIASDSALLCQQISQCLELGAEKITDDVFRKTTNQKQQTATALPNDLSGRVSVSEGSVVMPAAKEMGK